MENLIANMQQNVDICKAYKTQNPEISELCRDMKVRRTYEIEYFTTLEILGDPMDEPSESILNIDQRLVYNADTPDKRFLEQIMRHHQEGLLIIKSINTIELFQIKKEYEKELWTIISLLENATFLWKSPLLEDQENMYSK